MPVWSNDDWLTCLKEKELIINMVLVTYSILVTVLKWRPANGVVYTFAKMCIKSFFFSISSHKTSYTFQLLQISDVMRPEDDSCMDKVKEMYPRSKFWYFKVGNLQNINKTDIPSGSLLESFPKCLHKSPCTCQILKND